VPVTIAGTYTATVWVRADHPGATLTLRLRECSLALDDADDRASGADDGRT
jgi:hypothetical protein